MAAPIAPCAPAQCLGKVCHGSYSIAAKASHAASHKLGERFNPYRCRRCAWWHVGGTLEPRFPRRVERTRRAVE